MKPFALLLFATLIAVGQIFFKKAAIAIGEGGFLVGLLNKWLFAALLVCAAAVIVWVWILKTTPLNLAYAYSSIVYLTVPVAAYFAFNEKIDAFYAVGCLLIVIGVLVANL
jgi:drug/metabolite transporter (DMT)-like permease